MDRRTILSTVASTLLLGFVCDSARAAQRHVAAANWLRSIVELKEAMRAGEIGLLDWQHAVEACNRILPVDDIANWLDLDAVTRHFQYSTSLADYSDVALPVEFLGASVMNHWFVRVFGMRRGGGLLPHVHNNMVSAHLVIAGSFHVRTHDRLCDLSDAVVLRQRRDEVVGPGGVITMSDQSENQHWLTAETDRSHTLDIAVLDLPASWRYGLHANHFNTILVDTEQPLERDGTIVAPVLTLREAVAKFAS